MSKEQEQLLQWIDESDNIVFFGGAGVSTESKIPDFRSVDGLYKQNYDYPPETILSHSFYIRNPEEFYRFYRDKMLFPDADPNAAHIALANLEKQGKLKAVITQNIDGLHQKAGSKEVLELHGSVLRNHCTHCHKFYSLEDILKHKVDFPYSEARPILLFKEYLQHGYYPFFQEKGYLLRLQSIIKQTLENDIPTFANMNIATALKLKRLLYIIAKSVPFKPNFTKLATLLDMNRNTVSDLMCYLEKAGIINQLRAETEGVRLLGKVDKVYLNNTNLAYALSDNTPDIGNVRETFFFSTLRVVCPVTTSEVADFTVGGYTFEVGGKNKSQKQVHDVENAYVVKDDIEYGMRNVVPLWAFGFLY